MLLILRSLALLVFGQLLFISPTDVVCQAEVSRHLFAPDQAHSIIRSEWNNNLWAAVLARTAVPSLVDAGGYFFPSSEEDGALPEMSENRQGELDALTSPRFGDALEAHNVHLLTYRQLIAIQGLQFTRRPKG